jgi:hypothetical protein
LIGCAVCRRRIDEPNFVVDKSAASRWTCHLNLSDIDIGAEILGALSPGRCAVTMVDRWIAAGLGIGATLEENQQK